MFSVFFLTVVTIVGYSRMYNGVHSIDQVIFGGLIGVWIGFMGDSCIRKPLFNHIDNIYSTTPGKKIEYRSHII